MIAVQANFGRMDEIVLGILMIFLIEHICAKQNRMRRVSARMLLVRDKKVI
jgi:hypothetical protein